MKRILLAFAAAAMLGLPAQAADEMRYSGSFQVVGQTGTCPTSRVGDRYFARYRPGTLGGNPVDTYLTIFKTDYAQGFLRKNGNFPVGTLVTAQSVVMGSGFSKAPFNVSVKVTSQTPSTLTVLTPSIAIIGTIKGYDVQPNCTVTFRMGLGRSLD